MIVWSFIDYKDPTRVIDILLTYEVGEFHVETMSVAGHKVNVIGVEDLIFLKKQSGRPQDLVDIENLEGLLNE